MPWNPGLSMHDFVNETVYFKKTYLIIVFPKSGHLMV